jgi:pimeloyl-ACP methyl ester carboxylesterase
MTPRQGTVSNSDVRLNYLDWGGDGPPLVLIHATGFHAALWQPIAERLAERFRVVAVDQRGHGDSDNPPDGYRFETFAEDLQCVIEGLGLERPIAAGHSSGATTIVVHAAAHPGVIQRAVLIEPILPKQDWYTAPPGGRHASSLSEGARKRRPVWPSTAELFEAYRERDTFRTWREDQLRLYIEEGTFARDDGQVELKCPPEIESKFFDAVMLTDFWTLLPQIRMPSLVLWGPEGNLHGRLADHVQEALPQARTTVVPNTSHFLPQERPDEVARLMEEFFSD